MSVISLLQMIQISDSLFPIGSFTLSNGLETFVVQEKLTTEEDLEQYLENFMQLLPYNNLGIMVLAYKHAEDPALLRELDAMALALKVPREVREGTIRLCRRFLKLWMAIRQYPRLVWYQKEISAGNCMGDHAIAVGLYAKEIGLDREEAAAVYVYSLLMAIITNAVKTVPLSQISGQRIGNRFLEKVDACVRQAEELCIDDLGVSGPQMDIAAMNHETLYTRLYMS